MPPPVILIHGAFCTGRAMSQLAEAFRASGYTTLCPDLRHHAPKLRQRDMKALGFTSTRDYAADIKREIDGLTEKPILVGHSMGGLIAQMVAARTGVHALVLLAPSAPWGVLPSHWNEVASAFGLYMVNGQYWEQPLIPTYEIAAGHTLSRMAEAERRAAFDQMVPESGRAVFETMHWWLDVSRATEVPSRSLGCPVFCAAGSADEVSPPETVRRIAARYREQAAYRVYEGMSHWLIGEPGWERIAEDTVAWLKSSVDG